VVQNKWLVQYSPFLILTTDPRVQLPDRKKIYSRGNRHPHQGKNVSLEFDIIIIGAGMAVVSAAYELAKHKKVLILERESQPGYHATGRSAATYSQLYGNPLIQKLTIASKTFLTNPPEEISPHSLLAPNGVIFLGQTGQEKILDDFFMCQRKCVEDIEWLSPEEIFKKIPILKQNMISGGVFEKGAAEIDVHTLLNGYLKLFKQLGGVFRADLEAVSLKRTSQTWKVSTREELFSAPIIVNAAGAWADALAHRAGVRPLNLVPKKRTIILVDPPEGIEPKGWPVVVDVEENFYFKPKAGKILISPADETPCEPSDVQADEMDIASAVDKIQAVAALPVRQINHKWAGLRTFATDKSPVVGFDPKAPGFFWLAGQGGYGIQTAPSLARCCASLILESVLPKDLEAHDLQQKHLSPRRFNLF